MSITINFNDIDLNDWIDIDTEDVPTLKEIFREEILNKFVDKLNYDLEVKRYIRDNIDNNLYQKISSYKNDAAIEVIVKDIIEQKLKATGSFVFIDQYKQKVTECVDQYFKKLPEMIWEAVNTSLQDSIQTIVNNLYKESKFYEFLDVDKLTNYITETLKNKI